MFPFATGCTCWAPRSLSDDDNIRVRSINIDILFLRGLSGARLDGTVVSDAIL